MRFEKLNEMIPAVTGGKLKILSMSPYNAITLRMPGRHQNDTTPPGLDFVVCVDDEHMDWVEHQFTHNDIFNDLELKAKESTRPGLADGYFQDYLKVIRGDDPERLTANPDYERILPGLHPKTFLFAVQCLAVAEHRRYARFEPQFGGRYLPFRFSAGIVEGRWTAAEAVERQRRGRPGVEWLEKDHGIPTLTKVLMNK